jgi:hypothetical protein
MGLDLPINPVAPAGGPAKAGYIGSQPAQSWQISLAQ